MDVLTSTSLGTLDTVDMEGIALNSSMLHARKDGTFCFPASAFRICLPI